MPECYIRGNTIKYLRVPDEVCLKFSSHLLANYELTAHSCYLLCLVFFWPFSVCLLFSPSTKWNSS